jgi:hypothetical protein
MTPNCYTGKILHVDLTQGKTRIETPPEEFYRAYGGGSAMGAKGNLSCEGQAGTPWVARKSYPSFPGSHPTSR